MKIITHSDFDGLVCGVLLSEVFKPERIVITEPHIIRKGLIELTKEDVIADLPLPSKEVFMAFDHHSSSSKLPIKGDWFIVNPKALSCARIIYDKYKEKYTTLRKWEKLVKQCDKIDSATYTLKEYENPNCFQKLGTTLKTVDKELDKFYMQYLIKKILELKSIEKVSKLDWVEERYKYKMYSLKKWKGIISKYTTYQDKIIITDIRNAKEFIPKGNPFELYKIYPDSLVSILVTNSLTGVVIFAFSENIFNRKNKVNLGYIATKYNGGGHHGAAGCSIEEGKADMILKKIIEEIKNGNGTN